jgi:energy-coupling factor transporter ATP-binding protein EcfA2
VATDRSRRRGTLYLPPSALDRSRGFALSYPLDELLFQHHLAHAGGLVLHACGVAIGGRAVLFCGRSGAGKTTIARLFRRAFPEATVLSDDRIVIRRAGRHWRAFGTPWHGSGRFASARSCPVAAVVFLKKSRATRLAPIPVTAAAVRLLAQSFPPLWEREGVARSLRTATAMAASVPAYLLRFEPDRGAVEAVVDGLGLPGGRAGRRQGPRARRLLR